MPQSVKSPTLNLCSGLNLMVVSSNPTLNLHWAWKLLKKIKFKKIS